MANPIQRVRDMLVSEKPKLATLWGEDRYSRACSFVLMAVEKSPALQNCTPESIRTAIFEAAQLQLYPGASMGQAYLVPYGKTAEMVVGYKGLIELVRRSGQIRTICANIIRKDDEFIIELGTQKQLIHRPDWQGTSECIGAYAIAELINGGVEFEVMNMPQLEAIRKASKSKSGPWQYFPEEMRKKTVLRRLCKRLPVSTEYIEAIERDHEFPEKSDEKNHTFSEEVMTPKTTDVEIISQDAIEDEYARKFPD